MGYIKKYYTLNGITTYQGCYDDITGALVPDEMCEDNKCCCPQLNTACACIDNEMVTVLISTDPVTGEDLWYKRLDTREPITDPQWKACCGDCTTCEERWLLITKCELTDCVNPTNYPGITQLDVTFDDNTAVHPTEGFSIFNWNFYTMCACEQPSNDDNGAVWLKGNLEDYTISGITINSTIDYSCSSITEEPEELCSDDNGVPSCLTRDICEVFNDLGTNANPMSQQTYDSIRFNFTGNCNDVVIPERFNVGDIILYDTNGSNINIVSYVNQYLGPIGFVATPTTVIDSNGSDMPSFMRLEYPTCSDWTFDMMFTPIHYSSANPPYSGVRYEHIGGVFTVYLLDAASNIVPYTPGDFAANGNLSDLPLYNCAG